MRRSLFALTALFAFGISACKTRSFNGAQVKDESAEPAYFILKEGIASPFKGEPKNLADLGDNYCDLKPGKKYTYSGSAWKDSGHYRFTVTNEQFDCGFRTGFVYAEHVTLGGTETGGGQGGGNSDSPYCQYSWEEKPGTTDYTTYDSFRGISVSGDRPQSETLIGSQVQAGRSLCQKARALQHCYERVIMKSNESSAQRFRQWASSRGINPVLALMAKTEQETKMGMLKDQCSGGNCNGIGIGQIITAIGPEGRMLSNSDKRWDGITFNILTNLAYSVRVVAEKTSFSSDLYSLAYNYNGSSGAAPYASNVVRFYGQLQGCGL